MPIPNFEVEFDSILDSLSTISEIILRRFKCMECNQCEPCGEQFMNALSVLAKAGRGGAIQGEIQGRESTGV